MRSRYYIIMASLLVSLFIYLFYRTEKTVVSQIVLQFITYSKYSTFKTGIRTALPLNQLVIYSLPEGLWIFCITLTSKQFYIRFNRSVIQCVFLPITYAIALEILQLFHFVHGQFDFIDIFVALAFWLLGLSIYNDTVAGQDIFKNVNIQKLVCIGIYSVVYLSHVIV